MKSVYRLYRREGVFCSFHVATGKRESLHTRDEREAKTLIAAKLEAERQPVLNLKLARVYLAGSDPKASERTWADVLEQIIASKKDENRRRWEVFAKHQPCQKLWKRVVIETRAEDFLSVLNGGKVSTNKFLRVLHNFAQDMGWLQAPIIPKRQWPKVVYAPKRAITLEEHEQIIERETNPERRLFYELAWHTGAAQSDLANLHGEDITWADKTLSFFRKKTKEPVLIHFGATTEEVLHQLPSTGLLFPYMATVRAGDRATEFGQRCRGLGISGVTLHSYRYAWAERARICGYPLRFAMDALGHNSKAVHHAYAKRAEVVIPPLETYERDFLKRQILQFAQA
ncbi:MAG: tyrosine-type recombinase/integrase [Methylacidiphilales bacterium]|nr:tyrosine-type recombinase/integrase [Candidatus Methylacidiphilales bacterium]